MGWIIMLALALAVVAALWRWVRIDSGALQFFGAALLLALAGYAWQGRPALPGAPKEPPGRQNRPPSDFEQLRRPLLGETDAASGWLTMAESQQRVGDTHAGVEIIRSGLRQMPRDMDLRLGLANALILHAGGLITPAAQMAFAQADEVAPNHPAPTFFWALALARNGRVDEAEALQRRVLAMPELTEPWRNVINQELANIANFRAQQGLAGPAMR